MAEEFNQMLKELKRKPLEEKVNEIIESFGKITNIILKIPDMVDEKFRALEFRINKIDQQLLRRKQAKIEEAALAPPPPPPNPEIRISERSYSGADTKSAIMGELKELFEKRKKIDGG